MAGSNSTTISTTITNYRRSNITLELWIPYVLIGASCVTFLAVHFWCYHKRNRIRYLRKQDEFRVKLGLIERRRITSVIMSRYQAEIEVAANTNSDLPALHIPSETEVEVRPPMAYSQNVSLEDSVEVVMEEPVAAWETVGKFPRDQSPTDDRSSTQLHNTTHSLGENKMRSGFQEKGIQTDGLSVMEVNKLSEYTNGWKGSESVRREKHPTQLHKPEVVGIFSIPQRYAWGAYSSLNENIASNMSKDKHFRKHSDKLQTPFDLGDGQPDPVSGRELYVFHDFYDIKQTDSDKPNPKNMRMKEDSISRIHNVQPCSSQEDPVTYKMKYTPSSPQQGTSGTSKKFPRAHDLKSDTPPSSMSSPVSSSTVFVYHGHSPTDPHAIIDRHWDGQPDSSESSEELKSAQFAPASSQLSSAASIDNAFATFTPQQMVDSSGGKAPQAHAGLGCGVDQKTHIRKPISQTDEAETARAMDTSEDIFNKDIDSVSPNSSSQETQNQNLAPVNSHSTPKKLPKLDQKEPQLIKESKSNPPRNENVIARSSSSRISRVVDQSEKPEGNKIRVGDAETSLSVTV